MLIPQIKLFVGYRVTAELKNSTRDAEELGGLILASYEGKEYIGLYLDSTDPSLEEVKQIHKDVKKRLSLCCPEVHVESLPSVVFPQVFLG